MSGKKVSLVGEVHICTGGTYTVVNALGALKCIGIAYGLYDHAEELRDCRVALEDGEHPALVAQEDVSCHGSPLWKTVRTITDDPARIQRYMAFREAVKMVRQMKVERERQPAPEKPALPQKKARADHER